MPLHLTSQDIPSGSAHPEGNVIADIGALYRRTGTGLKDTLYIKVSGNDTNTGWQTTRGAFSGVGVVLPDISEGFETGDTFLVLGSPDVYYIAYDGGTGLGWHAAPSGATSASDLVFDPTGTGLNATNVQEAIEEIAAYPLGERINVSYETLILATGASQTALMPLAVRGYRLHTIATSRPARVRLYTRVGKRDLDLSRAVGTDPGPNSGLVLEYVTTLSVLAADLSPLVDGATLEPTTGWGAPMTVQNNGATGTVTVTFDYVRTE